MNIDLPKMYSWQQNVFVNLMHNWDNSIHVIKSRRQCGKSILCEILLMYSAIIRGKQKCYMLSPTFSQADKILAELKEMLQDKKTLYRGINNIKRIIYFKNGSEIRIFSAEQGDNLRGYTSNMLIIDEASYISDEVIDLVFPYVNVSKGPILLFSTPKAQKGNFYKYYMLGLQKTHNIFAYDWAQEDVSMLLPPEKLALLKMSMDPLMFRTDYLGEFLDGESRFFSDFSSCVKEKPVWNGEPVVFGIDWCGSTGGDYTAISIIGVNSKAVYDIIYFNTKDPQQTLDEIERLTKIYKPKKITVELNSIGNIYYNLLKAIIKPYKVPVFGFMTTNDSKDRIISKLQHAFQKNDITIFKDQELMDELQEYTLEFSKTGKRVFNAAAGHHDDLIMSLAIGYNSISSGEYHLMFP